MTNMQNYSKKTNILYLHAGAELYGADKVLLELVEGISSNYDPIVVLPCNGPLVKKFKEKNIEVLVLEYPILRRKIFNIKGMLKYSIDFIIYSRKIAKIAEKREAKLVHVNTTAVFEGVALRKMLKIPLVWHVHEIIVSPRAVSKVISWTVNHFSDSIIVVSKAVKQYLLASKQTNRETLKVIYNGVRTYSSVEISMLEEQAKKIRVSMGIGEDSIVIGMIGRINSWKGQTDFLKAVEYTLDKIPDSHAVIIGGVFEGEEWRMSDLLETIKLSPNHSRIHILDFQKDIIKYHSMFDIFVLPSTNPDPLPTVVLEAMSIGKPVLGYSHGGVTEMVCNPKNVLVEPHNIQNLSDKIFQFALNSSLRDLEGKENLERQQLIFNVDRYHNEFIDIYDELLGE